MTQHKNWLCSFIRVCSLYIIETFKKYKCAVVTGHVNNSVKARLQQCHTSGGPCIYLIHVDRLQSILHAAARLVNGSRKYDHVSLLLRDLHWLRVPERIMYRLAVLVFRCRNHTAPEYLTRDLHWVADDDSRRRLRSATTHQLMVPRTRLRTVGDRAFGIAGARVWNDLQSSVVSAPSLAVFKKNLKTHLFWQSYSHWRQRVLLTVVPCPWSFGLRHDNLDVFNNNNNKKVCACMETKTTQAACWDWSTHVQDKD